MDDLLFAYLFLIFLTLTILTSITKNKTFVWNWTDIYFVLFDCRQWLRQLRGRQFELLLSEQMDHATAETRRKEILSRHLLQGIHTQSAQIERT